MMSMQQKAFKNMVDNAPANIRINKEGRLLYPDGTTVPLYVPIHKDDRQKLFKDIRDDIRPLILKLCDEMFSKATEPMKRNIREIESNAVVVDKRLNRKIEEETQNLIRNFNGNLEEQRIEIENQMRLMQKLRARDKSDND